MKLRNLSVAAALVSAAAVGVAAVPAVPAPPSSASTPAQVLPLRFAMNAQGLAREISGQKRLEITLNKLSTDDQRNLLLGTLRERGAAAVREELQKMPEVGRARVGADLSYPIQYARAYPLEDGGWHVILATDRNIEIWEAVYRTRSVDYNLVFVELHLDAEFKGEGVLAAGIELGWNADTNTVIIEDYDTQPLRLKNVRPIDQ